jgi:hypothetical protein
MTASPTTSDTTKMSDTSKSSGAATPSADTTKSRSSDSAKANQTKSGVTNTKTGKSTLGPGVKKARPDQGQPVTSKGDTLKRGDSTSTSPR